MRPLRFALCASLVALFGVVPAQAIIIPCTMSGFVDVTPLHPGPNDGLAYGVSVFASWAMAEDKQYIYRHVAVTGRDVVVEIVFSPVPLNLEEGGPRPALVDLLVRGPFGPLSPGDYTITAILEQHYPTTGETTVLCVPRPPSAFTVNAMPGPTEVGRVVEYYATTTGQYFVTQYPQEQAILDGGDFWKRTGQTFPAYLPDGSDGRGEAVERFYFPPPGGAGDHFFTFRQSNVFPPGAIVETLNAFMMELPDWVDGRCPRGSASVYRLWNAVSGSGHRYTADAAVKAAMVAQGWVAEGTGPDAVFMCAPSSG